MKDVDFKEMGISKEILRALGSLGYKTPSEVQLQVIPAALKNKDIIVKSKTGSGKTAAFAIPVCEKVKLEEKNPQALVLVPTRELAVQVKEEISNIGRFKRIRCAAVFGKQPFEAQVRELKQRVHIIVGTPGRTIDHIEKGNIDLQDIKYLIIDEADEMLNMGFIDQVKEVTKHLPDHRITMLFSATISEEIDLLCRKYMNSPEKIEIQSKDEEDKTILQFCYETVENKKFDLLNKVIYKERPESCIIFCNTKDKVDMLSHKLIEKGYSCSGLHGGKEQKERLETINGFKNGEFQFLVATDVAARGIHIEDISLVINYDVPVEKESYVHRIGRTGRAGKSGIAITFVSPEENRNLKEVEEYIGFKIPMGEYPAEEELEKGKILFKDKSKIKRKASADKSANLNKDITKIYINAGKKKKIRAGDIVGAITSIAGINAEDIGIIDIQENISYVDILGGKGRTVIDELQRIPIKGKKIKAEKAAK